MSELAPKLDSADPDPEIPFPDPEPPEPASQEEDTKAAETEEACVVVKEDATPRGRRMCDEAREVAAAHASMLVDLEACKRVSMPRRRSYIVFSCLSRFFLSWKRDVRYSNEDTQNLTFYNTLCSGNFDTKIMVN